MQSRIIPRISVLGLTFLGCLLSAAPFARAQNPVRLSALPQGLVAAVESGNTSNLNRPGQFDRLAGGNSGFTGLIGGAGSAPSAAAAPPPQACQGAGDAKVVIQAIRPVPGPNQAPSVTLRNVGAKTANLTGYTLSTPLSSDVLHIADRRECAANATLEPGRLITFTPRSETNPCGFPFALNATATVRLSDPANNTLAETAWTDEAAGSQLVRQDDGSYARVNPGRNILQLLEDLGQFNTLLAAIKATKLDAALSAASDPAYTAPKVDDDSAPVNLEFPWWFGYKAPPPPSPSPSPADAAKPAPVGIPAAGPYTILAPTDAAFDQLLTQMGGGVKLPESALLARPELVDILQYHVLPGMFTSTYLRNNTPVFTAKGVEVVPFIDGCQTGGAIKLHDSCIDKPTPDNYTCKEQKVFEKCDFPFMTSALAAQWQGGFCQRTCGRCSCAPDSGINCATVSLVDVVGSNGVVHAIDRVLFPPPLFTKEAAIAEAAAFNATAGAGGAPGAATAPLPGATAAAAAPAPPAASAAPAAPAASPGGAPAPAAPAESPAPAAPSAQVGRRLRRV